MTNPTPVEVSSRINGITKISYYKDCEEDRGSGQPTNRSYPFLFCSISRLFIGQSFTLQFLSISALLYISYIPFVILFIVVQSSNDKTSATGISIPEDIKSRFAKGHMAAKESDLVFLPREVQGAGAMYSTVNDLLKYLSANMGLIGTKINGAMNESHLIRHPFDEIQPTFIDPSGRKSPGHEYIGSVWLSTTDLGRQVIWHNGGIDGYSSFIGFNPAKQTGLAILCSCYFTDVPPAEMIDVAMTFLLYH